MRLIIEPEAEAELEEAAQRYEEAVPGLGLDFILEMRARTEQILDAPHTYPIFGGADDVRCAHAVDRFPHLVIYLFADETVHVLAFMHPRRPPGYWLERLPKR